ncbi:ribonuclease H-like domain-containing protein [Phakopsora pachyrhizi]|uniref:poly(A)-specific ribonuclease n=1 Tax=Phakopsora pachyrhizi TaxID=170000 RepID=A0AAV0B3P3_PHAPC|nr:ribonuclease H-like domain-containing protein [Phakopsora pachyrhizi]CAH7681255.1 ribonuclease H-like domain-containing protein [Phakopsora pachyrhizi]CAH7686562.1 ribonuclease H-like domain-containing protein [Phakopsora pachyrhizi]
MSDRLEICDVWAENLDAEMAVIRDLVEYYPYIGMDTEFPGVVARPIGNFKTSSDYHYQTLRCNVDLLRIIQLGITLCDENGQKPEGKCVWQFNFRFSLNDDMFAPDSIELLQASGLNFKQHEEHGIDMEYFGELFISSGLVLLDDVKWISFHSGYDFGYILKMVTLVNLPANETDFFELLKIWFPCVYDIKFLMRSCKSLRGGLNEVAKDLGVLRRGKEHQAGSDSLLTADTFFALRSQYFDNELDDAKFLGQIYGLASSSNPQPFREMTPSSVDDPLAFPTDPIPTPHSVASTSSPYARRQIIQPHRHQLSNAQEPGPRASSAVSIKNPNAPNGSDGLQNPFGPARTGSPAVR